MLMGHLVGILTNRDIRFETDYSQKISSRMTSKNLITTSVGTSLEEAQQILAEHRIEKLPIVDADGILKGLITIKDILKVQQHPLSTKDEKGRLVVGAAIGALREPYERAKELHDAGVDFVVIDAAHGHSKGVMSCLKMLKEKLPDLKVIAGSVATPQGVKALAELGADGLSGGDWSWFDLYDSRGCRYRRSRSSLPSWSALMKRTALGFRPSLMAGFALQETLSNALPPVQAA